MELFTSSSIIRSQRISFTLYPFQPKAVLGKILNRKAQRAERRAGSEKMNIEHPTEILLRRAAEQHFTGQVERPTRHRRASTCPPPADRMLNGERQRQKRKAKRISLTEATEDTGQLKDEHPG